MNSKSNCMKSLKNTVLIAIVVLLLSSCAKIFYSPDAKALASKQDVIAIIQPKISIAARKKLMLRQLRNSKKQNP